MRTTGLGTGALTLWLYGIMAPRYGLPPMPPEIAAIVAALLMEGLEWLGKGGVQSPPAPQDGPGLSLER